MSRAFINPLINFQNIWKSFNDRILLKQTPFGSEDNFMVIIFVDKVSNLWFSRLFYGLAEYYSILQNSLWFGRIFYGLADYCIV